MLILLHIKAAVVVPVQTHGELESAEAVDYQALVGAGSHGSISEGHKLGMVRSKYLPCIVGALLQVDDHVATHQERCVCLLCVVEGGVVIYLVLRILLVGHQLFKLLAEEMHLPKI